MSARRGPPAGPWRTAGRGCLLAALGLLLVATSVSAAPVQLRLSGSVTFPDQSPDVAPVLGPQTVNLRVRVLGAPTTDTWVLTLIADSDLQSGADIIPASNISWTAGPNPPFQDGTLSTTMPVQVASSSGITRQWAAFSFYLQNSWDYAAGDYSGTATFTLSSP